MQYAICPVRTLPGAPSRTWAVVLQHEDVGAAATRLVAPLATTEDMRPVERLHPLIMFQDHEYFIAIDQMAAIPRSSIGPEAGDASHLRDEITRALDFLFTGF